MRVGRIGVAICYDLEFPEVTRKLAVAGAVEHFAPAVWAGANAVLAASVFHFGVLRIGEVKAALRNAGIQVR